MKKILGLIFCILGALLSIESFKYSKVFAYTEETKESIRQDFSCEESNDLVYFVIDKYVYDLDEEIDLTFSVETSFTVESVSYETDGFTVIQGPSLQQYSTSLLLNNLVESPYFEINLTLDNGQILLASVYGVVEEGKLYISSNSFESAREVYFAEKLQDGSMSQTTYENLISELYEESFDNEISFSNSDSTESNVTGNERT